MKHVYTSAILDHRNRSEENLGINLKPILGASGGLSFADYCRDWQLSHESGAIEPFLKKTHLDTCLTTQQWQDIISGKQTPDLALGYHLIAMMLQDTVYTAQAPYLTNKRSFYMLKNKHAYAIEQSKAQYESLLHVDRQSLAALRLAVARDVHASALNGTINSNTAPLPDDDFTQELLAALRVKFPEADDERFLMSYQNLLKENPQTLSYLLEHMLPDESPESINKWVADVLVSIPVKGQQGRIMRFLRHCQGLTHHDLEATTGVNYGNIGMLERNEKEYGMRNLGKLMTGLHLSAEESRLVQEIFFPALNSEWLNSQPLDERPKLLCAALCKRFDLSAYELSTMVGTSSNVIANYRYGTKKLSTKIIDKISEVFNAKDVALPEPQRIFTDTMASALYHTLPDKKCMILHPENMRAGALLRAIRERTTTLTMKEVGAAIGISEATQSLHETGKVPVRPERMEKYIHFFEAENKKLPEDRRWFTEEIATSLRQQAKKKTSVASTIELGEQTLWTAMATEARETITRPRRHGAAR